MGIRAPNAAPITTWQTVAIVVDRSWAGLMAFTPDGLPVVDHLDTSENVWFGGGFNGHGMPFGPIIGKLLAQTVSGEAVAAGLAPFAKSRPTLGQP